MQINTAKILAQSRGAHHVSIKKHENILNKNISIPFFKNNNQFKSRFFSELAVLLSSGMDIKKSLEIIITGVSKQTERQTVENIFKIVVNGSSLSLALEKSKIFNKYDYFSVKIGEESGSLSIVLKELAIFYSKKLSQNRQIIGALTYPILVLCTTLLSLIFMLNFIVPMFEDVFKRFNGNLPAITRSVIALSNSFSTLTLWILVVIFSLSMFFFLNRKKSWFRKLSSSILIRTPIAGSIIKLTYITRFCQTLKLLLTSRIHLLEALDMIRQMIGFYPLEIALFDIREKLTEGSALSETMQGYSIFDKKMIAMTKVAEEVNKLDIIYEQLFQQYSDELDTKIKTMNNLLEPILIIFVGGLVAFILVSMYMPIFQMGVNIK
jgi:type IV pilus assembly protein PilC